MAGTINKLKVNIETISKILLPTFLFSLFFLISSATIAGNYHFVVATDGSGDFRTVQVAINAVPRIS